MHSNIILRSTNEPSWPTLVSRETTLASLRVASHLPPSHSSLSQSSFRILLFLHRQLVLSFIDPIPDISSQCVCFGYHSASHIATLLLDNYFFSCFIVRYSCEKALQCTQWLTTNIGIDWASGSIRFNRELWTIWNNECHQTSGIWDQNLCSRPCGVCSWWCEYGTCR